MILSSCSTISPDFEPEPENYFDSQDFYDSLVVELAYTPAQKNIIDTGRGLLGARYVYGAQDPKIGFDCSGFTQYVYMHSIGKKLPRTAREMAAAGREINVSELKAGDLVFFNTLGYRYSHVGIYIGNGRFFQASPAKRRIVIGNMKDEYYAKRFNGARRVLS